MKVTTIDGGFRGRRARGLSAVPATSPALRVEVPRAVVRGSDLAARLSESFSADLADYDAARQELQVAVGRGALPGDAARDALAAMDALDDRRAELLASLARADRPEWLGNWQTDATAFVARANKFVEETRALLRGEASSRPWKVLGLTLACTALLGAGAWWLANRRA